MSEAGKKKEVVAMPPLYSFEQESRCEAKTSQVCSVAEASTAALSCSQWTLEANLAIIDLATFRQTLLAYRQFQHSYRHTPIDQEYAPVIAL